MAQPGRDNKVVHISKLEPILIQQNIDSRLANKQFNVKADDKTAYVSKSTLYWKPLTSRTAVCPYFGRVGLT